MPLLPTRDRPRPRECGSQNSRTDLPLPVARRRSVLEEKASLGRVLINHGYPCWAMSAFPFEADFQVRQHVRSAPPARSPMTAAIRRCSGPPRDFQLQRREIKIGTIGHRRSTPTGKKSLKINGLRLTSRLMTTVASQLRGFPWNWAIFRKVTLLSGARAF